MQMTLEMQTFSYPDLTDLFRCLADRMAAEQALLAELDGEIGDGDHGVAMSGGFAAAARALFNADAENQTLLQGFGLAAATLLNAVGATTGPLYSNALLHTGQRFGAQVHVPFDRLPEMIIGMAEGIAMRGHGKPGDKTMVDAWAPAAYVARTGLDDGQPTARILRLAAAAASDGTQATRAMMASRGRAARLGPRSIGHLDPGAVSAAALLDSLAQWAEGRTSEGA